MSRRRLTSPVNVRSSAPPGGDGELHIDYAIAHRSVSELGPTEIHAIKQEGERVLLSPSHCAFDPAPIYIEEGQAEEPLSPNPHHYSMSRSPIQNNAKLEYLGFSNGNIHPDRQALLNYHTPEGSPDPSQNRIIRSANVSPQNVRLPLRFFDSPASHLGTPSIKVEDDGEPFLEDIEQQAPESIESEVSSVDEDFANMDWDEDEWAEWEDALQDHAQKLEKRERFEERVAHAKVILGRLGFPPPSLSTSSESDEMDITTDDSRSETVSEVDETGSDMSDSISDNSAQTSEQSEQSSLLREQTIIQNEEPPTIFRDQAPHYDDNSEAHLLLNTSYDWVMRKWLSIRMTLPGLRTVEKNLPKSAVEDQPGVVFSNAPVCKRCGENHRDCQCDHCGACGEATDLCSCRPCRRCQQARNGSCRCSPCRHCGEFDNQNLALRCRCYCLCGCPIYGANCCLTTLEEKRERAALVESQDQRNMEYMHRLEKVAMMKRMYDWVELNHSVLVPRAMPGSCLDDVSGSYELHFNRKIHPPTTKPCRMIIRQSQNRLWGRYCYGDHIRGLFSSNIVPKYATTAAIPCEVAIANWKRNNKGWLTRIQATVSEDRDIDTDEGITFLGAGLIKLSPKFLGDKYSHHRDFVVFGILRASSTRSPDHPIKLENYDPELDNLDSFNKLWRAIHMMKNGGAHVSPNEYGLARSGRLSPMFEPAICDSPPWNEQAVDRWVYHLCEKDHQGLRRQ